MNRRKIKKCILSMLMATMLLVVILPVSSITTSVHAETKSITEKMVMHFSTSATTSSSKGDGVQDLLKVILSYVVYPQDNPSQITKGNVAIDNGASTSFTKPISVVITDGTVEYGGVFNFTVNYDTKTSTLSVNGVPTALNQNTLRDATVYPEAWLPQAVIGVGMNPLPFSQVKATAGLSDAAINAFNSRINGGITENISLSATSYGGTYQSNTRLSMYIGVWKRNPNGTYDTTSEKQVIQVIRSAADLLNGKATDSNFSGIQYYRQLVGVNVSSHIAVQDGDSVWNGKYTTEYYVQNNIGTSYEWGYNGVAGAVSDITNGSCLNSRSVNCAYYYQKFTRYEYVCSDYWRINYDSAWSSYKLTTTAEKTSLCKNETGLKYYRWDGATDTTGWTTTPYMSGYSQTAWGYRYQINVSAPVWGSAFWTLNRNANQNTIGSKLVPVYVPVIINSILIVNNGSTISSANMLTEVDVNTRVATYANGTVDDLVLKANGAIPKLLTTTYSILTSTVTARADTLAVNQFREGYNWGLYLYQTGHWRAIEIPIQWYEIGGTALVDTALWTDIIPPPIPIPDPDPTGTENSLIDFAYVQALFNQTVTANSNSSITAIQNLFMARIATDKNKAAMKFKEYYDALVLGGTSPAEAYIIISKDLNLNLTTK